MGKVEVLLVEDEPTLAMIIKDTLSGSELDITLAANGKKGLSRHAGVNPDIIVADIMMPKIDSFTMIRLIRRTNMYTPILFLSAHSTTNDMIEGLETGGSDYLKKPFGMAELIVRIKALLHKVSVQRPEATSFRIGLYTFDSTTQTLVCRGKEQLLSSRGSKILKCLYDNKDQVSPMKEILIDLWGDGSFFNAHSLHISITKLRHKLSENESIKILNIRGIGYKLVID